MSLVAAAAAAAGSSFVGVPRMSLCCVRVLPSCSADVSVMAPSLRRRNAMYVLEFFRRVGNCPRDSSAFFFFSWRRPLLALNIVDFCRGTTVRTEVVNLSTVFFSWEC